MFVTRAWVETPVGLLIRITVHVEDGKVRARMDAGVPAFDADPLTLRAIARALENAAATVADLLAELDSGRHTAPTPVDNSKIPEEVTERLGHLLGTTKPARSVSRRKSA